MLEVGEGFTRLRLPHLSPPSKAEGRIQSSLQSPCVPRRGQEVSIPCHKPNWPQLQPRAANCLICLCLD